MNYSQALVSYLMLSFVLIANMPRVFGGEYSHAHSEYPSYEAKQYEYHQHDHHDYHPPPAKKGANIDINIPLDFGTLAKFGILGLTQLKLLLALGKVAGAGLGVGALGLGQLGKIALSLGPAAKGGIAIDIGGGHKHHHHREGKHYEPVHHVPSEKHY